ncbi:uncharacterized protein KNAG_0K00950 [Huiozyma naganishii CBS 8797]|uniref:ABC transporter domain-containing protein n=1 Tax=Huiozyma naganishii (strain ATCC MYA-139 / BCRC 22969 / CBS 8797 / KCTC 17520 / NBRC 10181 / NCYC 3082 / Yp74L-3) TaxID=1071383 RepID=J7RC66_HUIN7|nr:hypothetical protein KNAG_0K00950 [Kazachstania naganishii CBS 8797]CCK72460.1 hypothetical protein KNAG_0K00950 [Kazachstania naganishii CBS 8797]
MTTNLVENKLSFSHVPRLKLQVRDLSIIASKTDAELVKSFSLDLPSGSIMAVMGGSGSGKTTLLNVLASKISGGLKTVGEINYIREDCGVNDGDHPEHAVMTYLPQQDVLPARLTCRDTMMFAADLKLDKPKHEKVQIVEQLIDELGLKDCADTIIGDSSHRGLSGGEKRRLSIGTQMIANPSIMFLDEPTTGLDAYSAYLVVKTIRKLAEDDGRIFIMSIHQPRSDIMFLLDKVCILSKGNIVYCDAVDKMIPYFESMGYKVPQLVNPADYIVDISSVDSRSEEAEEIATLRLTKLLANWKEYEKTNIKAETIEYDRQISVDNMTTMLPFWKQVWVLTRRNVKLNTSDHVTMIATILEPLIIGTIVGWIFYKPDKTTESGMRTIVACLYACVMLQCYLYLLFDTYRLCEQDIGIFDRERAEGSVSAFAFITARKISLFLSDDFYMILAFTTITYFMFGLEPDAKKFFLQFSIIFLTQLSCSGLATFSVAISRDYAKASLVGNMTFTILSMGCGFFVNAKKMPVYVRWTKYIAFSWYGFGALISSTFTDHLCTNPNDIRTCLGNQVVDTFGFWRNWRVVPAIVIFCFAIGYFFASMIILHFNKVDITLQNEVKTKDSGKEEKVYMTDGTSNDDSLPIKNSRLIQNSDKDIDLESKDSHPYEVEVSLKDITLTVDYIHVQGISQWRNKIINRERKKILRSVNATFKPGMVNAIMGPSGSGKSTLLNLISGRVKSTLFSRFTKDGSMSFNGAEVSETMFKQICSYVSQDDDHLLSKLTVRETFKFASDLRLHHLNAKEREAKRNNLIIALGLKHCEDTIIGNEFVKGISGGEKRRVTMGIQLLNDPPILLLDEPTSGLDSFTSSTILEILSNLCQEYGKTVILTIHQPRAELFKKFGNVLLLAKSGRTAFNGSPDEMIMYFEKLGFKCPELTNVADYFLDLISINTQNEQNESTSRERVEKLLANWEDQVQLQHAALESDPFNEKQLVMSSNDFQQQYGPCIRKQCDPTLAYYVNVKRQVTTMRRSFDTLMARIAQVPGLGAIFALYFAPIKYNYTSVSNRIGLTQESTALYFVGMLGNLTCYPMERDYFYREFEDNVYGIGPFFMAYMTLELPLTLFSSIIYSVLTVLACGLPRTAGNFFATVYCAFIVIACGEALGIMTNTLFERPGFVVNCISVILSIGCQLSGIMSLTMSRVLKGFSYLNPVHYTSMVLINLAFPADMELTCRDGGMNPDGTCIFANGRDVLDSYDLVVDTSKYLGIIICVGIIYRLLAYLVLKAKLEWLQW